MRGGIRGNLANRDVRGRWDSARALLQAPERSVEEGRVIRAAVVLTLAAALVGGCASSTSRTLTHRLVRQGTPSVDLGGSVPPKAASTPEVSAAAPGIREVSRITPSASDVDAQDTALRQALAAVHLAPSLAAHLAVAEQYRRLGILDQAFDHLQRGAAFDPESAAINDALARAWRDLGLPAMGLSYAHRAVYAAPRSATARHTLATVLFALGKRIEAERTFRDVVGLDPLAWYGWQNLCALAMLDGRTQEATTLCQRAAATRREATKAVSHERH